MGTGDQPGAGTRGRPAVAPWTVTPATAARIPAPGDARGRGLPPAVAQAPHQSRGADSAVRPLEIGLVAHRLHAALDRRGPGSPAHLGELVHQLVPLGAVPLLG